MAVKSENRKNYNRITKMHSYPYYLSVSPRRTTLIEIAVYSHTGVSYGGPGVVIVFVGLSPKEILG